MNIYNTIQNNNNNPIKFKLDKKKLIHKNKTNSLQINDKKDLINSFNFSKEKLVGNNIGIDFIKLNDNIIKHQKKQINKFLNNKTQSNSEAELMRVMKNKNSLLNTLTNNSLKKDNGIKNNNNEKKLNNNNNGNEIKKINIKEMKEKYHKLLRGNKLTHGSYDTTNRFQLFKKLRGLNNFMSTANNSTNNTMISNKIKRSPLNKKGILSPGQKMQNNLSNYIKSPNQKKFNLSIKETSIDNNHNYGVKMHMIGIKNKILDTNNKKMKFVKK